MFSSQGSLFILVPKIYFFPSLLLLLSPGSFALLQVAPANTLKVIGTQLKPRSELRELTLLRRENGEPVENLLIICLKADSYFALWRHHGPRPRYFVNKITKFVIFGCRLSILVIMTTVSRYFELFWINLNLRNFIQNLF